MIQVICDVCGKQLQDANITVKRVHIIWPNRL